MIGRPLAATSAYRIVASPYNGWLWRDQWYSDHEWLVNNEYARRKASLNAT